MVGNPCSFPHQGTECAACGAAVPSTSSHAHYVSTTLAQADALCSECHELTVRATLLVLRAWDAANALAGNSGSALEALRSHHIIAGVDGQLPL